MLSGWKFFLIELIFESNIHFIYYVITDNLDNWNFEIVRSRPTSFILFKIASHIESSSHPQYDGVWSRHNVASCESAMRALQVSIGGVLHRLHNRRSSRDRYSEELRGLVQTIITLNWFASVKAVHNKTIKNIAATDKSICYFAILQVWFDNRWLAKTAKRRKDP